MGLLGVYWGYIECILRLYWGYIGCILGLYRGDMGIMEKENGNYYLGFRVLGFQGSGFRVQALGCKDILPS